MAASSPAKTNSGATDPASATPSSSAASKSLRGLNKPKCIKCGNVARSRCPYQSCKNCCAKAQNPCHIHVLKGSSSLPDKPPSSGSPLFDSQATDASHSGNSHRLRQLSNNFAQFNNLQAPFRSRKPLTKKDAQIINDWRFLKLKEYQDKNIEAESEAFDRYMQNVNLLEEVFLFNSKPEGQSQDEEPSEVDPCAGGGDAESTVHGLKLRLSSNLVRNENFQKRIQYIVDQGLKKLSKMESAEGTGDLSDAEVPEQPAKKLKFSQGERVMALSDLSDKLSRARTEEDLKACWEAASQIFRWNPKTSHMETEVVQLSLEQKPPSDPSPEQVSRCFPPKWVCQATVDQEALCQLDAQFSSLEEIEDL